MVRSIKIFCDFDGTISKNDVRTLLFRTFGGQAAREAVAAWLEGKISGKECIQRECEAVGRVNIHELNRIIDAQKLDPTFPPFVEFCKGNNIEMEILSDGFDYYIHRMLAKYGLGELRVYANQLSVEGGILTPSFPYLNPYCNRTANCKGTHVLNNAGDNQLRVVVGDGYSDRCAVDYADVVFAKGKLIQYCRERNISFFEYSDFDDVRGRMEALRSKKRLKHRYRAEIRRREAFRIEANIQ